MIINLLVLQPIDLCNLNCSYCYLPGRRNPKLMSDDVLTASLKCVFNSSLVEPVHANESLKILWHSGEPLLAGIPFYENALALISKINTRHIPISMEFQSNATPITQKWCDFIKQHQCQIAVSIDGPAFLHDKYRRNWHNKGSHHLVMRGVQCLKENNIPLRAICVLTKDSLDHPHEIYDFFYQHQFESVCFNVEEQECFNTQSSLSLQQNANAASIIQKYHYFMSTFYNRWTQDNRKMHIREFGSILNAFQFLRRNHMQGYLPSAETLAFNMVTISKDGDISTFSPELSGGTKENPKAFTLGNVMNIDSLDELTSHPAFLKQLHDVNEGVKNCAATCNYFNLCGGGSASNKFYENNSFASTETSDCILGKKVLTQLLLDKLQADAR